jgi:hypothetical protein
MYAVFVDGLMESVQTKCSDSGIPFGGTLHVTPAYADDKAAASPTTSGLQRTFFAMKSYGDTGDCFANRSKSHIHMEGPPDAAAEAVQHDFR